MAAHLLGHTEIGMGFLFGSVLPDLDVVFVALGKSRFLRLHQGVTHSPLGIAGLSLAFCLVLSWLGGIPFWPMMAGSVAGMAVHVALDLMNTFGVRLFWPLRRRFSLDAFFFIDIYALTASCLAVAALLTSYDATSVVSAWALAVVSYAGLRALVRLRIVQRHGLKTAVPSGINPGSWFVTRVDGDGSVECGIASCFRPDVRWLRRYPGPDPALLDILRTGPVYGDLEHALKLFIPVSVISDGTGTTVVSRCVAVPNFGNGYGLTTSRIENGRVTDEVSAI